MTKDQQIAALRLALLEVLDAPAGNSSKALSKRMDALSQGHAVYCATAPEWQKREALKLANDTCKCAQFADYASAVKGCGRSILYATERH